ncbi:MAG: hypothetical protein HQL75_00515 [Magnetococcales bacterium]|nr:hypothetical protein [Magnetococcales bacterium]
MSSTSPHARDPGAPLPVPIPAPLVSDALQTLRDAAREGRIDPAFCQSIGTEFLAFANPCFSPNLITAAPDLLTVLDNLMGRLATMRQASYIARCSVNDYLPGLVARWRDPVRCPGCHQ